jgi:hypothetical protein
MPTHHSTSQHPPVPARWPFLDSENLAAAEPLVGSLIEIGDSPGGLRVRARYAHLRGDSARAVELMDTFQATFVDDWTEAASKLNDVP